jgi:hypothetical protein
VDNFLQTEVSAISQFSRGKNLSFLYSLEKYSFYLDGQLIVSKFTVIRLLSHVGFSVNIFSV